MSASSHETCLAAPTPLLPALTSPPQNPGAGPDISVIIATCNRPHTLVDAIRSALDQEGAVIEVIVVDDSVDHTAAGVVAGLDEDRVRYLTNWNSSNGRPAIPRNIGVGLAKASLIHFLDDDDLVAPGQYARARAAFAANAKIGVVFGRVEPFGDDAAEIDRERHYFSQAGRRARRCAHLGHRWAFTAAMLFGPTLMVCSAGIVRRESFDAVGGFDTVIPLVEDVDFFTRAIRHGGVHFLDHPALRYRVGPSLMRQPNGDAIVLESYRQAQARYRQRYGLVEFMTLKALAKGLFLT